MKKYLQEYCTGCGLCESYGMARLEVDKKGFCHPVSGDDNFLKAVCPAAGKQISGMDLSKIWGKAYAVYYGYSNDPGLRNAASSGGALTEIASFLLEKHEVDAVIHTFVSDACPTETQICISRTREELIARCGSRYSISHPLREISGLDHNLRYAFIGKPCDVTALKNYMKLNPEMESVIPYTLSFFCAGLPSADAQAELLRALKCDGSVVSLRYRGNGWPGYTTAIEENGAVHQMLYEDSWGKILGRDIMKMCRFCLDGIGEMADISCCDAWYMNDKREPDFSEHEGRNAIFCRSEKGLELLKAAADSERIHIEEFPDYCTQLDYIQKYQMDRRATMRAKIAALRIMGKKTPKYPIQSLDGFSHSVGIKRKFSVFKGTVKRVLQGKI